MSSRLSPAQARVVDAMRDGAELVSCRYDESWSLRCVGAVRPLHRQAGDAVWAAYRDQMRLAYTIGAPDDPMTVGYRLAPEYRGDAS